MGVGGVGWLWAMRGWKLWCTEPFREESLSQGEVDSADILNKKTVNEDTPSDAKERLCLAHNGTAGMCTIPMLLPVVL